MHPESNISWSNYTMCNAFTPEKMQVGSIAHFSIGGECHDLYTEVYA